MTVFGTLIQHVSGFTSGNPVAKTSSDGMNQASINSGSPIWIEEAKVTWTFGRIMVANPIDGSGDAVQIRQGTIDNPFIIIDGYIDVDKTATGNFVINDRTATTRMTQDLIASLSKFTNQTNSFLLLESKYGTGGTALKGRNLTSGYPGTTTSIVVAVKEVQLNIESNSEKNHFWTYRLTLQEDKKP